MKVLADKMQAKAVKYDQIDRAGEEEGREPILF